MKSGLCLTSRTPVRRVLVRLAPSRPPRSKRAARIALRAARALVSFSDWVYVRAEDVAFELEAVVAGDTEHV